MTTHVPVLVVGAGISGLVCAYALRKAGVDAQVVESERRPGGMIRSERRDGYLLELGPQSFSSTAQVLELCRELGIQDQLVDAPHHAPRFLLIHGQLRAVPLSPPAFFLSSLFSAGTKWKVLRDVFGSSTPPASGDESVAAFVRRKFSAELLDKLVGPFVSGIYAGDADKLSLRAAFPQLYEAERSAGSVVRGMIRAAKAKPKPRHKSTLQTFRDGNEKLVSALAEKLGPALRTGVRITAIQEGGAGHPWSGTRFVLNAQSSESADCIIADRLVLATPPNVVGNVLDEIPSGIKEGLQHIEFAPVAVISLGYERSAVQNSLEGFGFLIPRSEGMRILGTVWNSSLFPGRAPDGRVLLTTFLGGAGDRTAAALPKQDLIELTHKELAGILSIRGMPSFSNAEIHERALPQYNLGHSELVAEAEREVAHRTNLWLAGNYLRGPSIGACVEQALSVAQRIIARMKARGALR